LLIVRYSLKDFSTLATADETQIALALRSSSLRVFVHALIKVNQHHSSLHIANAARHLDKLAHKHKAHAGYRSDTYNSSSRSEHSDELLSHQKAES
jgi:hypothetical protein